MFPGSRPAEGPVGAQAGGDAGGVGGVRSAALCPPALRQRPPAVAQSPQSGGSRDGCGFTGIPPTRGPPPAPLGGSTQPPPHTAPVLRVLPGPAALPRGSAPHGPPKAGGTEAIAAPCTSGALRGSRWGGGCQPCSHRGHPDAALDWDLGGPSGARDTLPRCRAPPNRPPLPGARQGPGLPRTTTGVRRPRGPRVRSGVRLEREGGDSPTGGAAPTGGRPRTRREGPEQGRFTGAAA